MFEIRGPPRFMKRITIDNGALLHLHLLLIHLVLSLTDIHRALDGPRC